MNTTLSIDHCESLDVREHGIGFTHLYLLLSKLLLPPVHIRSHHIIYRSNNPLTHLNHSAKTSLQTLSTYAKLIEPQSRNRTDFLHECKSGALDNIRVIYRTFESIEITGSFDAQLIDALPRSVRFICHNGTHR